MRKMKKIVLGLVLSQVLSLGVFADDIKQLAKLKDFEHSSIDWEQPLIKMPTPKVAEVKLGYPIAEAYRLHIPALNVDVFYASGTVIKVSAGAPPKGKVFSHWRGWHVDDLRAAQTSFIMPQYDVELTPVFLDESFCDWVNKHNLKTEGHCFVEWTEN